MLSVPLFTIGCTTQASIKSQIEPRAAFDLNCPREQIQIALIDGGTSTGTYGATGCGGRVRYETMCSVAGSNCTIRASTASGGASDSTGGK
jgi:hypothetical protein